VGIIALLIAHFVVNHYVAEGGLLSHADVVAYYSNPLIVLMEAIFLTFVVSHSLIGIRSIVLDLKPSRGVLRVVDWVFSIGGVVAVVYGLWLIQAVIAQRPGV
jgi:succinate dehydrogenase / fumarate reductase membrane anchor subunit